MDGSSADVACPHDAVEIGDLAGAVNAWLTARWPVRRPDRSTVDLAAAVESWLVARSRVRPPEVGNGNVPVDTGESGEDAFGYPGGSLAQAVAESSSRRWVGVHRRSRRRGHAIRC